MGWKEALQITLFILAWIPVGILAGVTVFGVTQQYDQDFSIYNTDWNGMSNYREQIETVGYNVSSIQASMSVISRNNGSGVLVITGPVRDFSIDATVTILDHLMKGGGVLIADDFGTTNTSFMILNTLLLGGDTGLPVTTNGFLTLLDGVLLDLDSHDYNNPKFPRVTDLIDHPITQGVGALHLNWATALNPRSVLGMAGIAWTTDRAWVENNIDDPNPSPNATEYAGRLPVVGAIDMSGGGLGLDGRIVAVSDPSIFNNDMWEAHPDNQRFAMNIINWLSNGDTSVPILFSENLLAVPFTSAEFFYSAFLGRVLWMSTNIFLAPIYPLMTAIGIKRYLPDIKKPEVKSVSDVFLRRGQTYYSERMTYYRTEGNYTRVIKMLYRKLRRDLQKKHHWSQYDNKKVWELIRYKDPRLKETDFFKTISKIEEISSKPGMKIKEGEMMSLFFWMRNIQEKLVKTR